MVELARIWFELMTGAAIICFLVGEITQNYSQVDKLWSIMPVIYSSVTLISHPSPRILLMSALVTLWGLRLSYNFFRKGGYNLIPWKGEEDHRWKYLREHKALRGRIRFALFNFFFISFYQHFLILLFTSPLLEAAAYPERRLDFLDAVAALMIILFIIIETISDNQLYNFQLLKRQRNVKGPRWSESVRKGFMSEGLWKYVRHPNYAAEQAIWSSFYFFGVAASGKWLNWTIAGPVLLILLFQGSARLTERISSSKYREYEFYRESTPLFIPVLVHRKRKE